MDQTYPYTSFRFMVEIDDKNVASFSDVSGLGSEIEFEEFKEGGVNEFAYKLLKSVKYSNLVLKRGMIDSDYLFNWYKKILEGKFEARKVEIILKDPKEGNDLKSWSFKNAYPVKWVVSDLNAQGNSILIETLELAHQGMIL